LLGTCEPSISRVKAILLIADSNCAVIRNPAQIAIALPFDLGHDVPFLRVIARSRAMPRRVRKVLRSVWLLVESLGGQVWAAITNRPTALWLGTSMS
jgi:hypothetical protein